MGFAAENTPKSIDIKFHNYELERLDITKRLDWIYRHLKNIAVTSSFGAQSAVLLHLLHQHRHFNKLPVYIIDTGYLFNETYQYIEALSKLFTLKLRIVQPERSAAWQEAIYGKLWEKGLKGIEKYNEINKIQPLKTAFDKDNINTWITGLRRSQSKSRNNIDFVSYQNNRIKVNIIADWSDQQIDDHFEKNNLPRHPLVEKGFISIGDRQLSKSIFEVDKVEELRFFGLKRECGLHE